MFAGTWAWMLCAVAAMLFVPVYGADANGQGLGPECEKQKRAAMKKRLRGTTIDLIEGAIPKKWDHETATVNFMHMEFDRTGVDDRTLTYRCESARRHGTFPAYGGFAWMILMPDKTGFSLVAHGRVDTTIRSYLEEEADEGRDDIDALRVLVSGPFWKLSRRGDVPIGALVKGGLVEQDFRPNFSAKYVLCSTEKGGVDLLDGKVGMFGDSVSADRVECAAAIQVGPALFERSADDLREDAKLGIGADSRNRSRRNILIKVEVDATSRESEGRLILMSTLFDIAAYDAMVASELLVRELSDRGTLSGRGRIVWAVGLVDDESLSGPILTMNRGPTLELSEVSRPTGAIMQFVFNGSESDR